MTPILTLAVYSLALVAQNSEKAGDEKSDGNKMICKSFPPPSGTRLGARRVCQTRAEWKIEKQENKTALDRQQLRVPNNAQRPVG